MKPNSAYQSKGIAFILISLICLIFLVPVAVLPLSIYDLSVFETYLIVSILLVLYGLTGLFEHKIKFLPHSITLLDLAWGSMICYTALSMFWSSNPFYALCGCLNWVILYLIYRVFSSINWSIRFHRLAIKTTLFILILLPIAAIAYSLKGSLFPSLFPNESPNILIRDYFLNYNYVGSLIILLLPFFLMGENKKWVIAKFIILIPLFILLYKTDSLQVNMVFIAIIILRFIFLFQKSKWIKPILFSYILIACTGFGLFSSNFSFFKEKIPMFKEFSNMNDRIVMWEKSINLFKESPIIGHGSNSWFIEVGRYGYKDYLRKGTFDTTFRFEHPHNYIAKLLSELGILGIILFLGLGVIPLLKAIVDYQNLNQLEIAALISLIVFFCLAMVYGTVFNFFDNFSGLSVVGLFSLSILINKNILESISIPKIKWIIGFIAVSIVVMIAYIRIKHAVYLTKKGDQEFKNKNLKEAELSYQSALVFGDPTLIYEKLSSVYASQKQEDKAVQSLKMALDSDPYNIALNYKYAHHLFKNKRYSETIEICKKTKNLVSNYFPNSILLIESYQKEKDYENCIEAIAEFEKTITIFINIYSQTLKNKNASKHIKRINKKELDKFYAYQNKIHTIKNQLATQK